MSVSVGSYTTLDLRQGKGLVTNNNNYAHLGTQFLFKSNAVES